MDAIFNPVKRVSNYDVQNARVGQSTNYDKLVLEIWTDGTITPEKALGVASKDHDGSSALYFRHNPKKR